MEDQLKTHQIPNPVDKASIFAKATFSWIIPLFKYGYRSTLNVDDLYACPTADISETEGDHLQMEWEKELALMKRGCKPSLFKALSRTFGAFYSLVAMLILIEECFKNVMQPVMLGWVVRYFSVPGSLTKTQFYLAAAGVSIFGGGHILTHHPYFFNMQRIGMRMRIACCSLIYRKSLRLSQAALSKTAVGQMVNLLSNDVNRFDQSVLFIPYLIVGPLQMLIVAIILWQHIGPSCLAGIGFLILYIPYQGCMARCFSKLRAATASLTDERIRLTNEFVAGMRVIKMYTWETAFARLVNEARRKEVLKIRHASVLRAINMGVFFVSSKLVVFMCFVCFALIGGSLTAERVFVSLSLFNSLRLAMTLFFPFGIGQGAETWISIKRLERFLLLEEKEHTAALNHTNLRPKPEQCSLILNNVTASWNPRSEEPTLDQISCKVEPGELLAVVGPVGAGKTALLMAILGELPLSSGSIKCRGKISFASQEPWMFNASIKRNIVFDSPFLEERYRSVIQVCAMERDLTLFPYGDRTLVEDKGVSLSGGQKARVNLARALYYDADIYLLDDPLSAVDSAVAQHLVQEAILGCLGNRIVVLCTHQLQFLKSATKILVLAKGKTMSYCSYDELTSSGINLTEILENEKVQSPVTSHTSLPRSTSTLDGSGTDMHNNRLRKQSTLSTIPLETFDQRAIDMGSPGSLYESAFSITAEMDNIHLRSAPLAMYEEDGLSEDQDGPKQAEEERSEGGVEGRVYWEYLRAGAGNIILPILLVSNIAAQVLFNGSDFWLSYWSNEAQEMLNAQQEYNLTTNSSYYQLTHEEPSWFRKLWNIEDETKYNIFIYGIIVGGLFFASMVRTIFFFVMCMRSSVNLHNRMFQSIIRAPISFFDTNPIGRIQNRFSKDLGTIDDLLPPTGLDITFIFLNLLGVLVSVSIITPWIILPTLVLFFLFYYLRRFYMETARDIKRLEGITRSPVFSHLSTSLYGLTTIRAFNAQRTFEQLFDIKQDHHTSAWFLFLCTARWFGITLDSICFAYITIVTMSLAISTEFSEDTMSGGGVGLAIANALMLTGMFQWGVRQSTEIEAQMTSVERVLEYSNLPSEADFDSKPEKKPDKDWPQNGVVEFRNVSLAYKPYDPPVLKNLKFTINAKEKIGVVGRTGAGKSSIISALFRITEPEGQIVIDGINTREIGLHDLRSKISIIPQDPVLFTGPMRYNLDPFGKNCDEDLWRVLDEVELKNVVEELAGGLSTRVAEGGSNFSVGERQLICLARAILKQNKILVLDEATANVDPRTDNLIQEKIREKFAECTVITIAHRLHTVMDSDKILVLDAGRVIEFDSPYALMLNPRSTLNTMVMHTGSQMAHQLRNIAWEAYLARKSSISTGDPEPISESSSGEETAEESGGSNTTIRNKSANITADIVVQPTLNVLMIQDDCLQDNAVRV